MRIYVASSWRNQEQPNVVGSLRAAGHEVYDFKNPRPRDQGFHWSEIDPLWKSWGSLAYREALEHPIARAGFRSDMDALEACDACVLVLPCGRSAHLELGWAAGAGKRTAVLMLGPEEPELMYRMLHRVCVSVEEVVAWLSECGGSGEREGAPWTLRGKVCGGEVFDDGTTGIMVQVEGRQPVQMSVPARLILSPPSPSPEPAWQETPIHSESSRGPRHSPALIESNRPWGQDVREEPEPRTNEWPPEHLP